MLLLGFNNFEHLLALNCLLLLLNRFLLYVSFQYPLRSSKIIKVFYDFREYWKKTLERNGVMLPWEASQEVCPKPNAGFWTLVSPCTHIYGFGLPSLPCTLSLPTRTYVMFFAKQPLHHHLTHNACNTFL